MNKFKGILTLFIVLLSTSIFAQNSLVSNDSTKKAEVLLGEVIIKASRDESKLKDIPSAITSIRSCQIENNQIQTLEDVGGFIPNFVMLNYGTKLTSPVYIRGVGSKKDNPAVGLYVDGVPYFDFSSFNFDFYDIAHLEVLRGPQGTLYGRNSMGGLININTISPADYQGTRVRLSKGTYGTEEITIGHYGKINKKVAFSIGGNYRNNEGYFTNQYDDSKADKLKSYGLRNRLIYQVNDKLSIENTASYEDSRQNGYPFGLHIDSTNTTKDVNYNQTSSYNRKMLSDGMKIKYDESDWQADLTLSYQKIDDNQAIDQDFTIDSLYYVTQQQQQNTLSSEAIVRSKNNTTYNWLTGAFAYQQSLIKNVAVDIYEKNMVSLKDYDKTVQSIGVFHQSTLNLFDHLKITAGLRYNYEKTFLDYQYNLEMNGRIIPRVDSLYPSLEEHIILPKLAISYLWNDVTVYASYATGYKSGGFNSTFERNEDLTYTKELSDNFEVGAKFSLFDDLVFSDLAVFRTYIDGQQILRTVPSGQGVFLQNAGESKNTGVEATIRTLPIKGFEIALSYGYTQAEIIKYEENDSVNYNGNTTPYVPSHTLNVMLAKTITFDNKNSLQNIRIQANYQHFGTSYWRIENDYKQSDYGTLNAMLTFNFDQIKVDLWAKNIANTEYNSYMLRSLENTFHQKGLPQRFGTTLSMKF